jgi:hypothetical protein
VKGTEFGLWNFDVKFFVAIIDLVKACVWLCEWLNHGNGNEENFD